MKVGDDYSKNQNSSGKIKICKYCKSEISKQAKVCPQCGKKQGGKLKWIIIAIVAIGVIGAATGNNGSNSDDKPNSNNPENPTHKPTLAATKNDNEFDNDNKNKEENDKKDSDNEEEVIEITSTELIDAFEENQVNCKKLYHKKKLKVTGEVTSVGTDILNNVYVSLGHDTEYTFVGIQCYAKNKDTEDKIAELKEGDIITVIGTGDCGSLSFSLNKAEIVE